MKNITAMIMSDLDAYWQPTISSTIIDGNLDFGTPLGPIAPPPQMVQSGHKSPRKQGFQEPSHEKLKVSVGANSPWPFLGAL
jgi:hypothetical protein